MKQMDERQKQMIYKHGYETCIIMGTGIMILYLLNLFSIHLMEEKDALLGLLEISIIYFLIRNVGSDAFMKMDGFEDDFTSYNLLIGFFMVMGAAMAGISLTEIIQNHMIESQQITILMTGIGFVLYAIVLWKKIKEYKQMQFHSEKE